MTGMETLTGIDIMALYRESLATTVDDPYPTYRELRDAGRLYAGDVLKDFLGMPFSLAAPAGDRPVFTVLHHEDVVAVLRDASTFSSTVYQETLGRVMGTNLLMLDPPDHTRLRSLLGPAFTRKVIEGWESTVVQPTLHHRYIDGFVADKRADLLTQLAVTFPVDIIHQVLGLPGERSDELNTIAIGMLMIGTRPDLARLCSATLSDMLTEQIKLHRDEPGHTLIDSLIASRLDGDALSDGEILNFLRVLLPAGGDTTTKNLATLLFALLADPTQLELILNRPELLPAAIEEALRWEPPTAFVYRLAMRDTEIGGVPIPAGAGITVCIASANRDQKRYPDPDRFDVTRENTRHMSFAFGPHMCIGMTLARMEVAAATRGLLERLSGLRLDPVKPMPRIVGSTRRCPDAIPVMWD